MAGEQGDEGLRGEVGAGGIMGGGRGKGGVYRNMGRGKELALIEEAGI